MNRRTNFFDHSHYAKTQTQRDTAHSIFRLVSVTPQEPEIVNKTKTLAEQGFRNASACRPPEIGLEAFSKPTCRLLHWVSKFATVWALSPVPIRTDVRSSCCMLLDVANYGISCRHQFINTRNLWLRNLWLDGIWACQVTSAILLERNLLPNETWC